MQPLQKQKSWYWRTFFVCLGLAAALFLPHCIIDASQGDFFRYAGDFNDQMIPFYQYTNQFVKDGGTFSWATDLGSGFVNAYSYYSLGSPFFWLTILLPSRWMPWLMAPMMCLKFAVAGSGAYLWLRRWSKDQRMAMLAGCLYAFCGFNIYNIFFYFFLDAPAIFPYMLAALDDTAIDGKKGRFPAWVAVCLLNNYFFFAGQAVFLLLYFICMWATRRYPITIKKFGTLALETVIGCMAGSVLLVPTILSLLQNPRTIDPFTGYGYLVYGNSQQYLAILYSMFLMPDAPYLTDMFNAGITKWTSMSSYLPVVGIAAGLAFCRKRRRHPFTIIMKICLVCALVPGLNSLFYALNSSYYARWYYMPLLVLCGATAMALQDETANLWGANRLVAIFTVSAVAFALVPNADEDDNFILGVVDNPARFWAIFGISVLGVLIFALILRFFRYTRHYFPVLLAAVLGFSFLYGTVHISIAKYAQWYNDAEYVQQTYREADEVNAVLPDDAFYRLDAYNCYNNMGIWLDQSCIQFFHSTVAPHILEFYPTVGVTRDVNSKPDFELYALRGLLSVRYTLVPKSDQVSWEDEALKGWNLAETTTSYQIYENENWVPMGFAYEYYMTQDQFEGIAEEQRGNALMRAILLTGEQIEKYGELLKPISDEELETLDYDSYVQDCNARRAAGVTSFTANDYGFEAVTNYEESTLVFFSVPYDDGFTATVNGQSTQIEKVDNGLMAIRVPAGHAEISFVYETPGLDTGIKLSLTGIVLYAVYLLVMFLLDRRRRLSPEPAEIPESLWEELPLDEAEAFEQKVKPILQSEPQEEGSENIMEQPKENT